MMTKREYLIKVITGTDTEYTYMDLMDSGVSFDIVPEKYQTEMVCLTAACKIKNLPLIPKEYMTEVCWRCLFHEDKRAFEWMPDEFKTFEICVAAVQYDPRFFVLCPRKHQTYELATIAVLDTFYNCRDALSYIPKELIDRELCMKAVRTCPESLQFVPEEYIDEEMVRVVVCSLTLHRSIPWVFSGAAERFLNRELCLKIIETNVYFVRHFPDRILTPEFLMEAVRKNPYVLSHCPKEKITDEHYMAAYEKDAYSVHWFPEHLITRELLGEAIRRNPSCVTCAIKYIDDPDFYIEAAKENPDIVYRFPNHALHLLYKVFGDKKRELAFIKWVEE